MRFYITLLFFFVLVIFFLGGFTGLRYRFMSTLKKVISPSIKKKEAYKLNYSKKNLNKK